MNEAASAWRDVIPCYVSVQDRHLRIVETNEAFRHDFGDAIGEHCFRVYKQREAPCGDCPVLKTFEDGERHSSEETVITRAGDRAEMIVYSTPIRDQGGQVALVTETSTNITSIKKLQTELEQTRQYYSRLFDIVPCYISIQDRDLRIIECNRLHRQEFGEQTGKHCYDAYKRRAAPCTNCPVIKTFADGQVHTSEEVVVTREGHHADVVVLTSPILDPRGGITSVMEVSTNITEIKREHRLAMVGLAVAGIAHRLKNVLMGLEGGALMINAGFESSDAATLGDGRQMMERNVAKMGRIVRDLLYCSKEHRPRLQPDVCPAAVVREVHQLYRARTREDGIDLQLDLDGAPDAAVVDPEGLHRLVENLTTNAIDACRFDPAMSQKHHVIILRCHKGSGSETVIEVADNGAGIPEAIRKDVFRGFFSTKGTQGTGLGLLVAQKVVEEHGGRISFASTEGDGTTFTVVLPDIERSGDRTRTRGDSDEQEGTDNR